MARIYQSATMGDADVLVAIVDAQGMADLLVHRVSSWGLAHGDARWFITRDRQDATAVVHFTSPGFAQVNVCFVASYGEAGWQTDSKFRGRFG
ncbi:DUF6150 family protein [Massilia sp. CCM 9210]|uniref:DUF6150 family protein n=1 Tax=Massilia scottii TaxID=3057166 RepID=UPI002796D657|nr:DUF6150 family protein [Massilia sp. CCM 9210]MDQ1812081.1 DUF6150 family protein [Massilia sp. CCM 9210]